MLGCIRPSEYVTSVDAISRGEGNGKSSEGVVRGAHWVEIGNTESFKRLITCLGATAPLNM